ncbi:uncharacterized protein MONBRDRAFT_25125 [Monosiga brevicollis MX1]|uniref:beta-N-acetylhexosaminidase n=1 Tax=Monosiga brevicollis TaxID=81824 RepID=A9UYH4_MONBE|nr:uncharacterized protein MONBRDRAFT_25125 [Monosiga brevicollis MX1]EDQ89607.1 predicted protein [Monosiga brevicollis MX1]|eukprot:XP_001745636.1 hypothetical protein [Monosiga brevicollis MX1]
MLHPALSITADAELSLVAGAADRPYTLSWGGKSRTSMPLAQPFFAVTEITRAWRRASHMRMSIRVCTDPVPLIHQIIVFVNDTATAAAKPADVDESYTLNITAPTILISAQTEWGALYGLETLTQLVHYNQTTHAHTISHGPLFIRDAPRFTWRGLLLDTANHYLSLDAIKTTLDGMAMVKLNLLHWHIVDSYSFPMEVMQQQGLSQHGAWSASRVYRREDVDDVVRYARTRGIRVVPEIDVPGHAASWGASDPGLVSTCPVVNGTDIGNINVIPLNVAEERVYQVLGDVLNATATHFPDTTLHLGGDEVQFSCWTHDPLIQDFMTRHGLDELGLLIFFLNRTDALLPDSIQQVMLWDEMFDNLGPRLPELAHCKPIIEVWNNRTLMDAALAQGHDVLLATGFYLDRQTPVDGRPTHWFWVDTWVDMYEVELPEDRESPGRVLGGEACMWSEQVSDISLHTRLWPRLAGVAERLWSPADITDAALAAQRLGAVRCKMAARGVPIGPIWADYCSADTEFALISSTNHHNKPVQLTSGEMLAITLFMFLLGVFFVYIAACCFGIGFTVRPRDSNRTPLLPASTDSNIQSKSNIDLATDPVAPKPPRERLSALDVYRGLTIAVMILVDETGAAFPPIDHAPWNGLHLADTVVPSFDFIVGVSIALAFKRFDLEAGAQGQRWTAFKKATDRFLKLFGGITFMNYDLTNIRIFGILQRVAVCYFAVALMEIFLPRLTGALPADNGTWADWMRRTQHLFWRYRWHWFSAALLLAVHTSILYGVDVPDAFGERCGRGQLTPACNAATYIDRLILTVPHMYFPENGGDPAHADVTFKRLPECSSCSPGLCVAPADAPAWCLHGPFDPEGLVSSLTAIVTTIIGVHYGHVLRQIKSPMERIFQWSSFALLQLLLGLILHFSGIPLNINLYSVSFVLVTGGMTGLLLVLCYLIVDYRPTARWLWLPFMWLGTNAIVIFLCAEGDVIDWVLSCFYLEDPDRSLANILWPTGVYWGDDDDVRPYKPSYNYQIMLWCLAYIGVWVLLGRWMYNNKIFIKI